MAKWLIEIEVPVYADTREALAVKARALVDTLEGYLLYLPYYPVEGPPELYQKGGSAKP